MSVPKQKPGRSKQDYETPWKVVRAIERWPGESFAVDLAASDSNKKAPRCITVEQDSLCLSWFGLGRNKLLWLNPPFSNIDVWARKCRSESVLGARIVMLTPASVSTSWYAEHCFDACRTVFLRPRIQFVGACDPYPKDLMLTLWGLGAPGFELLDWSTFAPVVEAKYG